VGEFKCKDPRHGSAWGKYNNAALLKLLKALEAFEELNILILGETGVGKSTWINAFINYLTYDSLYEAMQFETLRCVIPCSFTTQIKDKSDSRGKLVQKDISIGSSLRLTYSPQYTNEQMHEDHERQSQRMP
jgi:hypothetical protein